MPAVRHLDEDQVDVIADVTLRLDRWRPFVVPLSLVYGGFLGGWATHAPNLFSLMALAGLVGVIVAGSTVFVRHLQRGILLNSIEADPQPLKEALRIAKKRRGPWRRRAFSSRKARERLATELLVAYGRPQVLDDKPADPAE